MELYETLLLVHILAALVWVGGGFMLVLLAYRAERAEDEVAMAYVVGQGDKLANKVFVPAAVTTLVMGILLTIDGPWSFGDLWIVLGLVGYAVSFVVGIGFIEPEGKRIHAAMEAGQPARGEFHIRRINVVSRMELAVLYVVVAAMALKPTADDVLTLVLMAVAVGAALAWGVPKLREARPDAVAAPTAD